MNKLFPLLLILQLCAACAKSSEPSTSEDEDFSEELIIGGHAVSKKSDLAASTVSLLDTKQGTLCTASILSNTIAISAAHCVQGDPDSMQLSFGPRSSGHDIRPVEDVAVPPSWESHRDQNTDTGDIALIKFSGGLPKGAQAATLMGASHHLSNGEIVTLAGFGITNGTNQTGSGNLRSVDIKISNAQFSRTEVLLDQTHNKGACHGDSGGPAFIQTNNGDLLLWGVTSRGVNDPSDRCAGESVYTKIQSYSRWINGVVRTWGK